MTDYNEAEIGRISPGVLKTLGDSGILEHANVLQEDPELTQAIADMLRATNDYDHAIRLIGSRALAEDVVDLAKVPLGATVDVLLSTWWPAHETNSSPRIADRVLVLHGLGGGVLKIIGSTFAPGFLSIGEHFAPSQAVRVGTSVRVRRKDTFAPELRIDDVVVIQPVGSSKLHPVRARHPNRSEGHLVLTGVQIDGRHILP